MSFIDALLNVLQVILFAVSPGFVIGYGAILALLWIFLFIAILADWTDKDPDPIVSLHKGDGKLINSFRGGALFYGVFILIGIIAPTLIVWGSGNGGGLFW